jgi:hypothetical protein
VTMDTSGPVPIVKVWHPSFEKMCQDLAKKVEAPAEAISIQLRPKSMPPSRVRNLGDIWIVSLEKKTLEVPATELPEPLRRIRGQAADVIFIGICRLKDSYSYSTEDVVFVLINKEDAQLLRDSIN